MRISRGGKGARPAITKEEAGEKEEQEKQKQKTPKGFAFRGK